MSNTRVPGEKSYIQQLPTYSVSRTVEEVKAEFGLDSVTYLASNENPFGCSPEVEAAMSELFSEAHRYPDGAGRELKKALAAHTGLDASNIFLGNGSNEVLESVAKGFLSEGDEVLLSEHSFAMYPILSTAYGAVARYVPMRDWCIDLNAIAEAVSSSTKVIYIANANNPTGTAFTGKQLSSFLTVVSPEVLVVLDEAYTEFSDADGHPTEALLSEFPNLIISRTFSKAYGLAGMRVGYGLADARLIRVFEKVRQPFNINYLALEAAKVALSDQGYLKACVQHNAVEKKRITDFFESSEVQYLPSQTNFIAVNLTVDASDCVHYMASQGVLVRPLKAYDMPSWIRVSIGKTEENDKFITVFKSWLEQKQL